MAESNVHAEPSEFVHFHEMASFDKTATGRYCRNSFSTRILQSAKMRTVSDTKLIQQLTNNTIYILEKT